LTRQYTPDSVPVTAINRVDLELERGAFLALLGPPGAGKSTLLHLLAALDRPTGGEIEVLGANLAALDDAAAARWRNRNVGLVFQCPSLIPAFTALGNVELALKYSYLKKGERVQHAASALRLVGLGDRLGHFPRQLSDLQQQRVAIARAVANDPDLLLCDEPTTDLDGGSAHEILELLKSLNEQHGKTIILVTHHPHVAHFAREVRYIEKGALLAEGRKPEDWT
jgi:putative ABC transport system ATP-binding protein